MTEFLKILGKGLLVALGLSVIGLWIWQSYINSLQSEQQKKVSDIIKNTIEFEAQKDVLLPELVFINADSTRKQELTDSLLSQITTFLTKKYLDNRESSVDDIALKPFFVLTNKPDSAGNHILTENQLNELKAHIDFLTKQVEKEVDRTKEEVGRDIDRLNTWVSIWIGVIGFLGIFIPIVLNIDVSKRASEAKEEAGMAKADSETAKRDSEKATKDAKAALDKINEAEPKIKEITELKGKVDNAEQKLEEIEKLSNSASESAEKAIDESFKLKGNISIIIAINGLKDFGPQTIIHFTKETILPQYKRVLTGVLNELKANSEYYNSDLMKNWLGQIAINIQTISFYKFIKPEQTKLMNEYAELITNALDNYSRQQFNQIVEGLEELIVNLNTND